MKQGQPWRTDIVEGQPIKVGARELIPVVKVRSIVRRGVTFGTQASRGSGGGVIWLQPLAVIERRPDGGEQRIAIRDETAEVLKPLLAGALALPLLYLVVVALTFLWRKSR